jgi:hypothetical protein
MSIYHTEVNDGTATTLPYYPISGFNVTTSKPYAVVTLSVSGYFRTDNATSGGAMHFTVRSMGGPSLSMRVPYRCGDSYWIGSMTRQIVISTSSTNSFSVSWFNTPDNPLSNVMPTINSDGESYISLTIGTHNN